MSISSEPHARPGTHRRRLLVACTLLAMAGGTLALGGCADEEEPTATRGLGDFDAPEARHVYYGRGTMIRSPAVITADTVYAQIPEYQQIRERGLSDGQAEYHLLMQKASTRFGTAVKLMAGDLGHDLVAEVGSLHARRPDVAEPPDRTQEVIAHLR